MTVARLEVAQTRFRSPGADCRTDQRYADHGAEAAPEERHPPCIKKHKRVVLSLSDDYGGTTSDGALLNQLDCE
jgi:hypothetical protein